MYLVLVCETPTSFLDKLYYVAVRPMPAISSLIADGTTLE
jgi:hypothetical protein